MDLSEYIGVLNYFNPALDQMEKHITIQVDGKDYPQIDSTEPSKVNLSRRPSHPRTPYPPAPPTAKPQHANLDVPTSPFKIRPPESSYTSFIPLRPGATPFTSPPSLPDIDRVLESNSSSSTSQPESEVAEIFSRFQDAKPPKRKLPFKKIHIVLTSVSLIISIVALVFVIVIYSDMNRLIK